jgi:hypothetical protein
MFKVMRCESCYPDSWRTEEAVFKTYEEAENYAIECDRCFALDVWYEIDEE